MRVGIATDHGGFSLKEELVARLRAAGHEVVDFGAHTLNAEDDYPDFVVPLAEAVAAGQVERGVAICGSGVGASVCANKVAGIRAALDPRPLLREARRRGRSPEHPLHGRPDCRAGRRLGSRPDVSGRRVQPGRAASAAPGKVARMEARIDNGTEQTAKVTDTMTRRHRLDPDCRHQHHPDAVDGCGPAGQLRASWNADGARAAGLHALESRHALRSPGPDLAQPRPLRALERPCLDAALVACST